MVALRPYHDGDLAQLQEIAVLAWEPVFASFASLMGPVVFAGIFPDWREEKRQQIAAACHGEYGARIIVATEGAQPVGFVSYYMNREAGVGEISNNAVHPDYQGKGIATRMYTFVLDEMREAGMRCAQVSTGDDASHAPARRAYEKAGFRRGVPSITYYLEF